MIPVSTVFLLFSSQPLFSPPRFLITPSPEALKNNKPPGSQLEEKTVTKNLAFEGTNVGRKTVAVEKQWKEE